MTAFGAEDQSKLKRAQTLRAQQLAATGDWEDAVALNQEILAATPRDVAALNRLGKALSELGRYGEAHEAYNRALDVDPVNQIARRNLLRLDPLKGHDNTAAADERRRAHTQARHSMFIEEIGKTRLTELVNVASDDILAQMASGDQVELRAEGRQIVVYNENGFRLGQVETRLGQRLSALADGGNRYSAAVTAVEPGMLRVLVRETYQHPSQKGRLSFPIDAKPLAPRPYLRPTERPYLGDEVDFLSDEDEDTDDETDTEDEDEFTESEESLNDDNEEEQSG
ncbi:MAG: tetratricopeptide repeat protein [Thermomicrobiales bacterium]